MPRFWSLLAAIAGAAIAAAVLVLALMLWQGPERGFGARVLPTIGGPFSLLDQDGKAVTERDLLGKWSLVYFGYTRCPDECPATLNDIALALDKLGPRKEDVRPVFISVDPEHDTPAVLKSYVAKFAAPILALTGTPAQIAQAAKAYRVYYEPPRQGGGEVAHSTFIYLMDPRGRFVTNFSEQTKPEELAQALKKRLS